MLVDPNWRRQGVSRKLLEAAIALARELGARAIEAFPRRSDGMRAEELWTGSADVFIDAGFEEIHELGPYPVLKKVLR
jgi:GNAT superfamily N-acetyltransferase